MTSAYPALQRSGNLAHRAKRQVFKSTLTLSEPALVTAKLAIGAVPDLKVGLASTRFEMLAVGVPAILGAVLAALASLIQTKPRVVASAP